MDLKEFSIEMKRKMNLLNIEIDEKGIKNFYEYKELLLEWNEKINLTAITDEKEIILKHFIDSVCISKYIDMSHNVIDVGTGAGFPGIPLNIINDNNITLLDSLNKRIKFLEEVISKLELINIKATHSRVEDFARNNREKFDIATSRAVASLNVLLEYQLPLVKVGGKCICMKGPNIEEELENSKKALSILGGEIELIEKIILPESDIERNIIVIKKIRSTPDKYPRKSGTAAKEPI